ncbi:hypothetical protein MNB_SV-13-270 [hydrothermal vent metagenome]|uniref:DUF1882 domain-containing protein n=1 Tax=hydrothermal vent metagenome TaxID=652676 RepID=A0A1W1D176_9ZZZZ
MKVKIFDLEFDREFYYIQREKIVDKVSFNNRTLYSKFEKIDKLPTPLLIKQHLGGELVVALPLIQNNSIDYIVLEYEREDSNSFFYLIKHLLKSLQIELFYTYESNKKNFIQIFIPVVDLTVERVYSQVEKIKRMLELKSSKRCKILPNKNLPIKYNKITLPAKKM